MNKHFIYYPGFDPIHKANLKSFTSAGDCIIFHFHNGDNQNWKFDTGFQRAQTYAFLVNQYTDRSSSNRLKDVLKDGKKDYVFSATVNDDEIILEWQSGEKSDIDLGTLSYHEIILDLLEQGEIKVIWNSKRDRPYPFNLKGQK